MKKIQSIKSRRLRIADRRWKQKLCVIAMLMILVLGVIGCGSQSKDNNHNTDENVTTETNSNATDSDTNGSITIVYTNDVHSYIDNVIKDDEDQVVGDGLRFSKIAAMVNDMRNDGENVLLVDAGDEIQGNVYGSMDEGATIIDIMNQTGYQLATPGNHEFDYGVTQFLKIAEQAKFPYVTCNFHATDGSQLKLSDSQIFEIAGKKVAFVGISTPETISSSTPTYFQNEKGEFIYTVDGEDDPKEMYARVQESVDAVKDQADYIIALGHLGATENEKSAGISSEDVIQHVSGLNAFIDGHSHTTMEGDSIKDKDGHDVILTQTGNYLSAVGVMKIAEDGKITTQLVNDYEREDADVAKLEGDWIKQISDEMCEVIATLDSTLYISNPENTKERWVRAKEMNLGDFTADSIYWYFNEKMNLDCDVAIINGGGIRNQIEQGDVSTLSAKQVEPFGNMICLISATGQQIVDALEMGVTLSGEWDSEANIPAENGGFIHVAGLCYRIDTSVASSVKTDENGMFVSVDGEYKVKDVKIYNKTTGTYENIDCAKSYQLAGINYLLRNSGNGLSMFANDDLKVDYVGQDYAILAEYMRSFAAGSDGKPVINTKNSPLSSYNGYLIDYENPLGAGRIVGQ